MSEAPLTSGPLEKMLAALLNYGTWLASAAIGVGLVVALIGSNAGLGVATIGIVLFILLPISRVLLMFGLFMHARDYRLAMTAALVLAIIAAGCLIGMRMVPASNGV